LDLAGFFIEGYLRKIDKRVGSGQTVLVQPAILVPGHTRRVAVDVEDILPSRRTLTKLDLIKEDILPADPVPLNSIKVEPRSGILTEDRLEFFFNTYPLISLTLAQVLAALDTPNEDHQITTDFTETRLEKKGERPCIITGSEAPVYKMIRAEPLTFIPGESLDDVRASFQGCIECDLGTKRDLRGRTTVFGRGPETALGMIIGEAPGIWEEDHDIAFHPEAPAGNILHRVMTKVGQNQDDWFLTNATICRPEPPDGSRAQNGKPTVNHIQACSSRLKRTIRAIQPKLIVLLGAVAFRAFYGREVNGVKKNLGWQADLPSCRVYLALHPSYVLRVKDILDTGLQEQLAYLKAWTEIADYIETL